MIIHELKRKLFHLLIIIFPVTYCLAGRWPSLLLFSSLGIFVVSFDYFRHKNQFINNFFCKFFGSILREYEFSGKRLCGVSFVFIAACLNFLLFKTEIAVTAFFILAISDATAALVGKIFCSWPFFEKSFFGSLAFFVSGIFILVTCGIIFHVDSWFYFFGIFTIACVTMLEARPSLTKIDDNFLIPIGFSTILAFFDILWHY